MTSHQIVAVDVPQPHGHGRVERTATAGRTLGAGGSAGTNRTRADLLAQLENEQAAGDPTWRHPWTTKAGLLAQLEAEQEADAPDWSVPAHRYVVPRQLPTVVRLHRYARRAA